MIHRLAKRLGPAATAHVRAMHGETVLQRKLRHAADVARIARPFQAVDHDDLTMRISGGSLFMDQHLSIRIGPVELLCYREANGIQATPCEVRQDRENVRVAE